MSSQTISSQFENFGFVVGEETRKTRSEALDLRVDADLDEVYHCRRPSLTLTVASDDEVSDGEAGESSESDESVDDAAPLATVRSAVNRFAERSMPMATGRPRSSSTNTLGVASYVWRGRTPGRLAPPDHLRRELRSIPSASRSRSPSNSLSASATSSFSQESSSMPQSIGIIIVPIGSSEADDDFAVLPVNPIFLEAPVGSNIGPAKYIHCRSISVPDGVCAQTLRTTA